MARSQHAPPIHKGHHRSHEKITAVVRGLVSTHKPPSRPARLPQKVPHVQSKYGPRRSPPPPSSRPTSVIEQWALPSHMAQLALPHP